MSELLYPPRGMSRVAAAYVGVSPSLFDAMVGDGRMPGPKLINTRTVWDRFALDRAWAEVERFCRDIKKIASTLDFKVSTFGRISAQAGPPSSRPTTIRTCRNYEHGL
jgi:hypothetical protein